MDGAREQIQSTTENNMGKRITRPEAANYLGISVRTLEKWAVVGGGPPYYRLGGRVVYDIADLDTYLAERRRTSTSEYGIENAAAN